MAGPSRDDSPRRPSLIGGRVARLVLLALSVVVFGLNAAAIAIVWRSGAAQERALDTTLRGTAEFFATVLPPEDFFWVLPLVVDPQTGRLDAERLATYEDSPAWQGLQQALAAIETSGSEKSAVILTTQGEPLLTVEGLVGAVATPELQVDPIPLRTAVSGRTASTPYRGSERSKRVYVPLRDGTGAIVGVLRVEAGREFFAPVRTAARRMLYGTVALWILVVVLWVMLARLLRRALEAERAAAQADRLRTLGTLTAGIAHEIRNPLGILTLEIEDLRARLGEIEEGPLRRDLLSGTATLSGEVKRLGSLTDQFLAYARPGDEAANPCADVFASVQRTLGLFRKGLDVSRVELVAVLPEAAVPVTLSEEHLRQVLLNLLQNASEALANRPRGRIEVSGSVDDGRVILRVADDGPGMDASVAAQAFDPFFTTRAQGTGLGLALCRKLVESAGGRIQLKTAPGTGAEFTLTLPQVLHGLQ